jgi:hypothetical protein
MTRLIQLPTVPTSVALGLALLLSLTTSRAITSGELDGDRHPNVGAILRDLPGWGYVPDCSGTLIHGRVLLTAGHCSVSVERDLQEGVEVYVSFDAEDALDQNTWIRVVGAVTHPEFGMTNVRADHHANDIGVLILEAAVTGIEPATLPPLNYLDTLRRTRALNSRTLLTVVGYGALLDWPPPQTVYIDGPRRVAQSRYLALNPSFLFMLQNQAAGYAGTGNGDSGGPTFYKSHDGTEILVSITSWGDPKLVATGISYRVDIEAAQLFIDSVLAELGGD